MNKLIFLLIKKELYNFFHSLFFYTSIFINLIFCLIIIKSSSSLSYIPLFSIIIIPLLTMHLWSEEKDLQDTLPVTDSLLILSKLFSSLITYLIIIIPIFIISFINNNELIIIFTSLFLIIFYASSAISLCLFLNLFTTNKALSFLISFLILFFTSIIN